MKSYRKTILIIPFVFSSLLASAQTETSCADGLDDDNDGFIDCYDPDCSNASACDDFYFGNSVVCQEEPTENPTFSIRLKWASANQTSHTYGVPAIGDLDNDGIPEVIATNHLNNTLSILNGSTGDVLSSRTFSFTMEESVAVGVMGNEDCAWIFVSGWYNNNIMALDCTLTEMWSTTTSTSSSNGSADKTHLLSLADFNQDGAPELYHANEIYDAETGQKLVSGSGDYLYDVAFGSIAVDILDDVECTDCAGLELISGNIIYSCLLYTSPSPRDGLLSRMPSSA